MLHPSLRPNSDIPLDSLVLTPFVMPLLFFVPRGMQTLPRRGSTGNPTPSGASLGLRAPPRLQGCGDVSGRHSTSSSYRLGGGSAALVPGLSGERTFLFLSFSMSLLCFAVAAQGFIYSPTCLSRPRSIYLLAVDSRGYRVPSCLVNLLLSYCGTNGRLLRRTWKDESPPTRRRETWSLSEQ